MAPPSKRPSTPQTSPLDVPDYELEAIPIGPASNLLVLECDRAGNVAYRLGKQEAQVFEIGKIYAGRKIVVIDTLRLIALIDPQTSQLLGLAGRIGKRVLEFLFGDQWGTWIDGNNQRHSCNDPLQVMIDSGMMIDADHKYNTIAFSFNLNIYNREAFRPETRRTFREGRFRHLLSIIYRFPDGKFLGAKVALHDLKTGSHHSSLNVKEFPLLSGDKMTPEPVESKPKPKPKPKPKAKPRLKRPKKMQEASPKPKSEGRVRRTADSESAASKKSTRGQAKAQPRARATSTSTRPDPEAARSKTRSRPSRAPLAKMPRSPTGARPKTGGRRSDAKEREPFKEPPVPPTEHLSLTEMIILIQFEEDSERRWKMIEDNLKVNRPERTYTLILNFVELIMDNTPSWSAMRMQSVFKDQPGSLLIGIMNDWTVNQVLAVSEGNSESEKILQWLREREVERLLRLDLDSPPINNDQARRDLFVDRGADAQSIRKAWRTLLGFMNADHGRRNERAIHRKKDEVAKHLQSARDLLLRRPR